MKNTISAVALLLLLVSCKKEEKTIDSSGEQTKNEINNKKIETLPYKLIKNYYLKTSRTDLNKPKIESQEEFNNIFGYASNSSNDGASTKIDFSKQYVIAVTKNETNLETILKPLNLQKKGNELILTYRYLTGEKQSFSTKPNFAIIVNKSITGKIVLKEVH